MSISTFVDIPTVDFFIFILGLFRIQSHGTGIVKLKSLTTMKYIAIGNLGQIYSTVGAKRVEVILITMNTVTGFN